MKVLVVGATGATGTRVVQQLLSRGANVTAIVRSKERMNEAVPGQDNFEAIEASLLEIPQEDLVDYVNDCDAVISCLGHNMTMKGMFGEPRTLVTDAVERLCKAIEKRQKPTKLILMGSNGVANPDGTDNIRPLSERAVLSMLRTLVPPHKDNELAAAYLSDSVKKDNKLIRWCIVRPDDLIDGDVSKYNIYAIPQKGLFGGGQATRANVAHLMCELVENEKTWEEWEFKMPVIMNTEEKTA